MGLDFTHCDAHFSYSGFADFRRELWKSCGFTGDLYKLYDDQEFKDQIRKDHELYDLFNHSDCDGELTPEQMKTIIPKLKLIVENWEGGEYPNDYNKKHGLLLIEGMKLAVKNNENLEFC